MKFVWIAALMCAPIFLTTASAEDALAPGQVSSESSATTATGQTPEPYQDVPAVEPEEAIAAPQGSADQPGGTTSEAGPKSKSVNVPGLVTNGDVHFVNDRFDLVFLRIRLLNGSVQNIRMKRGETYSAPTRGEPAICVCWNHLKPVYRCLSPDPVAVPVDSVFRFGQPGSFKYCSASF